MTATLSTGDTGLRAPTGALVSSCAPLARTIVYVSGVSEKVM